MRGAGRQLLASIENLITYWVLGLPLAILLGVYFNLGVEGLWWALCITTSVQVGMASGTLRWCAAGYMHGSFQSRHAAHLICLCSHCSIQTLHVCQSEKTCVKAASKTGHDRSVDR